MYGSGVVQCKRRRIRRSIDFRFCMKTDTACYSLPTEQRMHRSLRGSDSRLRVASIRHKATVFVFPGDGCAERAGSVRTLFRRSGPASATGSLGELPRPYSVEVSSPKGRDGWQTEATGPW